MDNLPNSRTSRFAKFSGIRRPNDEIITFHAWQNIILSSEEITSFYGRRPGGVASDAKGTHCVFLEFTRPMDSVTSSDEARGDWAETQRERNVRTMRDMVCTFTASIILAPTMGDPGTAHNPTSELEHAAPSRGPNSKTDSAFSG